MKQKAAAFLAVCMTVGSLPAGSAAAVPAETNGTPEDSNVAEIIEFDPVKLKDAMDQAVKNDEMVTPPTVVASSSDITGFSSAVFELKDAEKLLVTGSDMPDNTDVRIFLAPESEGYGEDGEYSLTGNESMIFMVENQGGEDQGYQLLFGNRITDVIEVKSKDRLLAEYYNPEDLDKATDSDTATPSESEAFETESGEDPTATGSETVAAAERSLFDRLTGTMVAYGAELKATASESGEVGENGRDEAEVPSAPAEENAEDEKEPSLSQETMPETEAPQESVPETEETQESRPEAEAPAETAPETETEAAEEEEMNHFTAYDTAVDENGYVRLSSGEISSSLLVVKNSFDKVDAEEGMDEPMAIRFAATKRMAKMANEGNSIALMSMDDEAETVADSKLTAAAFFVTTAANVLANGDDGESPFTVNLYDYAGTGRDKGIINSYLESKGDKIRFDDQPKNSSGISTGEPYNYWEYTGWDRKTSKVNIYQGIPENVDKNIIDHLFTEGDVDYQGRKAIQAYLDVKVDSFEDSFFKYDAETGTYSYNSDDNYAKYDDSKKALTSSFHDEGKNGFWPFDEEENISQEDGVNWTGKNWYFGMSVAFDFYRPEDGKINGTDMQFSFSGDDDVWVYLTNKDTDEKMLVLDLGGIHGVEDGTINFATGEVRYSNENARTNERYNGGTVYPVIYNKEGCETKIASDGSYSTYSTGTEGNLADFIKNGKNFTLEFYYLERGGNASNCKLEFNLPAIPKQGISILKQLRGKYEESDVTDSQYSFYLVHSNDLEALKAYRDGNVDQENVEIEPYSMIGAGRINTEEIVSENEYFYVAEAIPDNTNSVSWGVGTSGTQIRPIKGASESVDINGFSCSPIYQMPEETTGFLFTCTNQIGTMSPTIAKRAWKDWTEEDSGEYDITLEVHGDQMSQTTTEEGTTPIDLVVVIDKSGSMKGSIGEIKKAISNNSSWPGTQQQDIISSLPEGSHLAVVAYSDDDMNGGVISDRSRYNERYTDVLKGQSPYYYETTGWTTIGGDAENTINSFLYGWHGYGGISASGGTHIAGGVVGANKLLSDSEIRESSNRKVVILMTDGAPTYAIDEEQTIDWWDGSTYGKVVGNRGQTWGQTSEKIKEITDQQFRKLKENSTQPAIYVVGYGISSSDETWLEESQNINEYKGSNDLNEIIEAMLNYVHGSTSTIELQVTTVTDQLSENVGLGTIMVNNQSVQAPELWLAEAVVSGTSKSGGDASPQKIPDEQKGQKLSPVSYKNGIVTYEDSEGNEIATYNTSTHTITWQINEEMGEEDVKTLTYHVTAIESTDEKYEGDFGTGTHSGEEGYRSNVSAIVSYNDGTKDTEKVFNHPVVVPVTPKSSLTIQKVVKGINGTTDIPPKGKYEFKVEFGDGIRVSGKPDVAEWDDPEKAYIVELNNEGEATFEGIPVGTKYTVTETGSENVDEEYVLTGITAQIAAEKPVEANTPRPETLSISGVIQKDAGENKVVFTNTYGKYQYITLKKEVVGKDSPTDEYTFKVTVNDQEYPDSPYMIPADDTATIRIEPEDADETFTITESDTKGAWKTTVSKNNENPKDRTTIEAKAGDEILFTNYYYEHTLTLQKKVDGSNPNPDAEYQFEILMDTNGEELSFNELQLSSKDGVTVPETALTALGKAETYDYKLTVSLKADQSLTISFPEKVIGYQAGEILEEDVNSDYDLELEKVTKTIVDGSSRDLESKEDVHTFKTDEDEKVILEFTNKYVRKTAELTITKTVDQADSKGPLSFTFKIQGENDQYFFTTVTLAKDDKEESVKLNLPTGKYKISEVDSAVRYQLSGIEVDGKEVVEPAGNDKYASVTVGEDKNVTFYNIRTSDGYFTDLSSVVNEVGENGFEPSRAVDSLGETAGVSYLARVGAYLVPDKIQEVPLSKDDRVLPA